MVEHTEYTKQTLEVISEAGMGKRNDLHATCDLT
jgi:hypothetical protein